MSQAEAVRRDMCFREGVVLATAPNKKTDQWGHHDYQNCREACLWKISYLF